LRQKLNQKKPKKKKKIIDPYRNLKKLAYHSSQLPDRYNKEDLLRYAKFQLARRAKRLLKDPIWDEYTEEELLIEFYAHQFEDNDQFRIKFEQESGMFDGVVDDFAAWADKKMAEDAKIRDMTMGESEDHISFSPDDVMGDD